METTKKHIKTIPKTQFSRKKFLIWGLKKFTLRVIDILIAFVWGLVASRSVDMACY